MEINSAFLFYLFGGITLASAVFILFTRNVLYAAFLLIITFLGVAAIYVIAQAPFVAITQLLIYVGGVLVLLVFGIMLTNRMAGQKVISSSMNRGISGLLVVLLAAILIRATLSVDYTQLPWISKGAELASTNSTEQIGFSFLSDHLLVFEVLGVLLLVALIGASYIAKKT